MDPKWWEAGLVACVPSSQLRPSVCYLLEGLYGYMPFAGLPVCRNVVESVQHALLDGSGVFFKILRTYIN